MTSWRSRIGPAFLMSGYLLFYGVLFAEAAYSLPRLHRSGLSIFDAEWFRSRWFEVSLGYGPFRWLAGNPCQRFPGLSSALLVAAALALALGYLGALRAVQRRPEAWTLRRLLALAAFTALPLLLLLPPTSGDYVAYVFAGRVLSVYHQSPWHHYLMEFPAEHCYLSPQAWGLGLQCIYGPVWAAVMAVTTGFSHLAMPGDMTFGSLMLNVLLLRAANAAALAAAGIAVWRINGRLWPQQQRLATAAFLLNPLVVFEALGALHNDIWGVALLLWTVDLVLRDDHRFVVPLALSFLTKYAVFAMTPFLGIYYWRQRDWSRLGWLTATVLLCLGLTQLTSVNHVAQRVVAGRHIFHLSAESLPQFTAVLLVMAGGLPALSSSLVQMSANLLGLLCLPLFAALVWRTRTREQVIVHTLWAMVIYFTCVYVDSMPWYYLWPLGLLCVTRWSRAAVNLLGASSLVMLGYLIQFWNHSGIDGWEIRTLVPGFLLSIALPALFGLAGWRGWSVLGGGGEGVIRPSQRRL